MTDSTEIHAYPLDPGGAFASNLHRRVLGQLPHDDGDPETPDSITVADLAARLNIDADSLRKRGRPPEVELVPWTESDLRSLLEELRTDQYADYSETEEGEVRWVATEPGIEALNGPALTHPVVEDGVTKLIEPPPMEGDRLEQAEAVNEAAAREVEEYERRMAAERLERAEAELAEAEARVEEVES